MIGLPSLHGPLTPPQKILTSIATWFYAIASAAGFLFFGCNFGEEAGASTEVWVLRACIVQGLQQIWVSALWYWGSQLTGKDPNNYVAPQFLVYVVWPLAVISLAFAYCLFFGLPDYYRQIPPYVPNFYKTLFRRKLVIWFLVAEVLRNYWLSAPYGRNWSYLWSNVQVPPWAVVIMIIIFFIGVWGLLMGLLIREFHCFRARVNKHKLTSIRINQTTPRCIRGCCQSSLSVSAVHDGVRCGGVYQASVFTSHGVDLSARTLEPVSGCGSVFSTPSKVLVSE